MNIDWTLLLLLVIAALGVLGLVIALQTNGGKKRLAEGGLKLAEALIALADKWLEQVLPDVNVPTAAATTNDLDRARAAQAVLQRCQAKDARQTRSTPTHRGVG